MTDSLDITIRLIATLLLIAVNALYVFHEFAFVALKPRQIHRFDQEESKLSRLISRMSHNLDHYIAVDQLGITASSLAVGWVGQPAVTGIFRALFGELGLSATVMTAISAVIAFALLTSTQMIVGELMPKTFALRHAARTARFTARPVELTAMLFYPFVWLLNGIGLLLVRMMGFEGTSDGEGRVMPAEELVAIVKSSARAGVLAADPRALGRLLHFSDLRAHDLMVPRLDMVAISVEASFDDVLRTAQAHRFDKYPVYRDSTDHIVGMLNVKSLLVTTVDGDDSEVDWHRWVEPIPTLPDGAPVEVLLATFQQTQQQMVLLVDEFGATEGIVTVTDVIEQLIDGPGEIQDETPESVRLEGHASVAAVESEYGISIAEEDSFSDTIAGLVLSRLGRIPDPGDTVVIGGHDVEVVEMDGHRIAEVRIGITPAARPPADEGV